MHFYAIKALAHTLLVPPDALLILAIVGAVLLALRRRRSGWSCLIISLALWWALSVPVVADGLSLLAQGYPAFDPATPTNAQAIVILGGAGSRSHAPEYGGQPAVELDLLERINYGAYLSRLTNLPILVTSDPGNVLAMAVALRRDFQIRPRWVEYRSRDTFDNARNSAAMLRADHVRSILLVTSATHMLRAVREFSATGLMVTAAPVDVATSHDVPPYCYLPQPEAMLRSNRAIYELIGERVRELLVVMRLRRQQSSTS
ncbi:MAG TPA: YdcF family protein [Steroidobacteraceae bacterium]|nr:YdcF family protein [Steroidobacteraceae bacterium]